MAANYKMSAPFYTISNENYGEIFKKIILHVSAKDVLSNTTRSSLFLIPFGLFTVYKQIEHSTLKFI
jgi:hypothetical protein